MFSGGRERVHWERMGQPTFQTCFFSPFLTFIDEKQEINIMINEVPFTIMIISNLVTKKKAN